MPYIITNIVPTLSPTLCQHCRQHCANIVTNCRLMAICSVFLDIICNLMLVMADTILVHSLRYALLRITFRVPWPLLSAGDGPVTPVSPQTLPGESLYRLCSLSLSHHKSRRSHHHAPRRSPASERSPPTPHRHTCSTPHHRTRNGAPATKDARDAAPLW